MAEANFDELEDRFINFAVLIIKISSQLPNTAAGRHVSGQILRSGTSPAPNYAEARGAESRADFIHKLAIVLKELNETAIWLQIIKRSEMLSDKILDSGIDECNQLARIIMSSIKTARTRSGR
jgi:four helix bundle protein